MARTADARPGERQGEHNDLNDHGYRSAAASTKSDGWEGKRAQCSKNSCEQTCMPACLHAHIRACMY
eukprot:2711515-Pleurochrysis_carterae.AAC.2